MRDFQLRSDLERAVIDGFAMPLGIVPGSVTAPTQGYTVSFNPGENDDPDTYVFHVVVSHERISAILRAIFSLLPDHVYPIVEIGSRDAYRSVDVYLSGELVDRSQFLATWTLFEPFLLEDGTIAAGANADEPFIEVFLDQWKGISVHIPPSMREDVELLLRGQDLEEVGETWDPVADAAAGDPHIRPVLAIHDEHSPDLDELLLQLRHEWLLELNIDPDQNLDEGGRRLGLTLWHAVIIVINDTTKRGAYADVWVTAESLAEAEHLLRMAIEGQSEWRYAETYTIDRVAFDDRPDQLGDLPPRPVAAAVHSVEYDAWNNVAPPLADENEHA